MSDRPLPSGWLPPKPPAHMTSPQAPQRPMGEWPRPPQTEPPMPSSPVAVAAIGVSAGAILLLVATAGVSYAISLVLSLSGFLMARQAQRRARLGDPIRPGQARAAVVASAIALGLAGLAALVWALLAANGITPADLADWLRQQATRVRGH
ncbi:MAG: hypothetical protein QOE86_307 [Solirubrobacteraceae bacterium]|jgi:hypothetical protein|nr:hypothetical protein [Solirubrobacteraceae bacterium]